MTRQYDNKRREEQAEATRQRILDATLALLEDDPDRALRIPAVAARAGVSVPSIYRHFGNKAGLFAAASHILTTRMGSPQPLPKEGVVPNIPGICEFLESNRETIRLASARAGLADVLRHGRDARDARYLDAIADDVGHLSEEDARAVAALLRTILGSASWLEYRGRHGLSAETAERAVTWATMTLVERLHRDAANGRDLSDPSEETGDSSDHRQPTKDST